LVFGAALLLGGGGNTQVEDRLQALTKNRGRGGARDAEAPSLLNSALDEAPNMIEQFAAKLNLRNFLDQAGWEMSPTKFLAISLGSATALTLVYLYFSPLKLVAPMVFGFVAVLPFMYAMFMRGRRMKKFGSQLIDALDLISQALRAGQSLPAGIQLVAQQMDEPLGPEFKRAYEEQNLGVALEDSLTNMTDRVPNLDLRFFVTSVILQRQTGGDLAEILDKIGKLIRERYQIWGQIQALTGEGRLSGIVLLALPPALFLVMLRLNYDYVMMLFEDPLGQKMLVFGIVMQILGAAAIKKIITIKV
jgi:tight adherence protein B